MSAFSPEYPRLFRNEDSPHTPFTVNQSLVDLFEAQVMRTPQSVALIADEQWLTYQDLDMQANRLAHALQQQGVGPHVLVGLYLPRSLDVIVALLAVLKAGGAYIPLDPAYPSDHIAMVLEDAQPAIILTHTKSCSALSYPRVKTQYLDLKAAHLATYPITPPTRTSLPEQLAYVIYTSGSTGRPKGVGCNHSGVVNLLTDFEQRQPLRKGDRCSLWTSISFDVSVYEIFSALLCGQTLSIVPEDVRSNGMMLAQWLYTHKINSAYIPPFLLADLAFWSQKRAEVLALRRLLVGVEPINEQLLTSIYQRLPDLCIINGYGPTETTICATLYTV
ncbi:MAG: AMP-binding protein, partial [Ktedonobacteraceae bacterium]